MKILPLDPLLTEPRTVYPAPYTPHPTFNLCAANPRFEPHALRSRTRADDGPSFQSSSLFDDPSKPQAKKQDNCVESGAGARGMPGGFVPMRLSLGQRMRRTGLRGETGRGGSVELQTGR